MPKFLSSSSPERFSQSFSMEDNVELISAFNSQLAAVTSVNKTDAPMSLFFGPEGQLAHCQFCQMRVKTTVTSRSSTRTHTLAIALTACFCCCIPYCCNSYKNSIHSCPNCDVILGVYYS